MSMKKILMAAVAASAISAAGSAGAVTLTGTTVGAQTVVGGTVSAPVFTPYALATEYKYVTLPTGTANLRAAITTGSLASGQYLVTFRLSGAAGFVTSSTSTSLLTFSGTPTPSATTAVVADNTAQLVSFFVTVGAGDYVDGITFAAPIAMTSIGDVNASAEVRFAANDTIEVDGVSLTPDAKIIAATRSFYAKIGLFPATNATASTVSDFRQFKLASPNPNVVAATLQTASIGSLQFTTYVPTFARDGYNAAAGVVFNSLSGVVNAGNTSDTTDLAPGATATFGGSTGANENLVLGVSADAVTAIAAGVDTIAASALGATDLTTTIAPVASTSYFVQATTTSTTTSGARLADSSYTATAKPALVSSTHNQPAVADVIPLGTIGYEGVTIKAAWIGDGTNGFDFRIRIANQASTPLGEVKVLLLNPTSTATASSYVVTPSVPALGELTISSAQLKAALGSFGRSDLKVIVQGAQDNISAKMRVINGATGIVNEQTLGFGAIPAQVQ
jgi:hypothetical protein